MATKKRPAPRKISGVPGGAAAAARSRGSYGSVSQKGGGNGARTSAPIRPTGAKGQPGAARPRPGAPAAPRGKTSGSMPVQMPRRGASPGLVGAGAAGVVIIALVIIIIVALSSGGPAPKKQKPVTLSPQAIHQTINVPPAVLDQVGTGGNSISSSGSNNVVNLVKGKLASSAAVPTIGGKPQFFYYGAEWCPYCATERWSMIIALSRFGTFSGLTGIKSYSADIYPNTNTYTFYGSHYASPYIAFDPVEGEDTAKNPLQGTTAWQTKLLNRWDVPAGQPAGTWSFPFIDIGGKYIGAIAQWDNPQLLQNLSWSQIAQTLSEPSNPAGQELNAAANYLTAAICKVTGQQPSNVCTSAGVAAAAKQLAKAPTAVPLAGS